MKITRLNLIPWLIVFLGGFNLWTTFFPTQHSPLSRFLDILWPFSSTNSRAFLAIAGLSLLYLGIGLVQRRKLAWFLVELLLLASAVVQVRHYNSLEGAVINLAMAIFLFFQRRQFYGAILSLNWWRAAVFLMVISALLFLYLSLIFWLAGRYFATPYSWSAVSRTVLASFWNLRWQGPTLGSARLNWFFQTFPYLLGLFAFYSLTLLFHTSSYQQQQHFAHWLVAKKLIRRYGRTSADFFKLWPANLRFFFWRHSLIAYWARGSNFLAAGDPVGPTQEREKIVKAFLHFSGQQNANPLFVGVDNANRQLLAKIGLRSIYISDEAFVDLHRHPDDIKELRNVKTKLEKRRGYRFAVWQPPLNGQQLKQLRAISQSWLKNLQRRDGEALFGSGWVANMVRASWVPLVLNPQNQPVAFLTLHRSFRPQTMVVDLMRYRLPAENGIMEYLVSKTWLWLAGKKMRWLDLGAAPRQGARLQKLRLPLPLPQKRLSFSAWQKDIRRLPQKTLALPQKLRFQGANFFYFSLLGVLATSYRGLRHFKDKFQPVWKPRYLAYLDLPSLLYVLWIWRWQKPRPLGHEAAHQRYYQFLLEHNQLN